jgi:hypothetical protein
MRNKAHKPVRGILQEFKVVPITDPAEQAALDRRIATAERSLAHRSERKRTKGKAK